MSQWHEGQCPQRPVHQKMIVLSGCCRHGTLAACQQKKRVGAMAELSSQLPCTASTVLEQAKSSFLPNRMPVVRLATACAPCCWQSSALIEAVVSAGSGYAQHQACGKACPRCVRHSEYAAGSAVYPYIQ